MLDPRTLLEGLSILLGDIGDSACSNRRICRKLPNSHWLPLQQTSSDNPGLLLAGWSRIGEVLTSHAEILCTPSPPGVAS